MLFLEILVIIGAVSIVLGNIIAYVYKKKKHIPTGECACCSKGKNLNKMISNVKAELDKENSCCI